MRAAPAIGTLLVALSIYYAGARLRGVYAMYMAWVVIAAALFLDTRLILAHGAFAIGAYAFVLSLLEGSDGLDPLRIVMTAGTVLVVALVMGGIAAQLREVLRAPSRRPPSTDPLTGLLNRGRSRRRSTSSLRARARGGFGVGVVMLDLDGFKEFNDEQGTRPATPRFSV